MSQSHSHAHSHAHEKQGLLSPYLARRRYQISAKYVKAGDTVLDLGCGVGGFRKYLPEGTTYYGIDSQKNWKGKSDFLFKGEIGKPLPAEVIKSKPNVVTALAIIEHLDKPEALFKDAAKVLAPSGTVVVTTPHPLGRMIHDMGSKIGIFSSHASEEHEDFLDRKELERIGGNEGYEMIEYERFLFGLNQVAVFKKK